MLDTSQKTPLSRSLNEFAQNKIRDFMAIQGKVLPASITEVNGSIVTVKFELNAPFPLPAVTVPVEGSQYIRVPFQVGEKGIVVPSDYYLGGVSGLGGGTAGTSLPANLSALVFVPISNKGWDPADDPNKVVIWGPDGAILRNKDKKSRVETNDQQTLMAFGEYKVYLDATGFHIEAPIAGVVNGVGGSVNFGNNNINTTGQVTSGNISLQGHHHLAPNGNTGPALP